jgi:DNA-binding transcriptional regulator LsrR (DeoR family)
MKTVELYARVRHAVLIEGISERAAADRFGINARTVSKMLKFSVPPGYVRRKPPFRPKLDEFTGVIDEILATDRDRPKKQQHASKQIFERLRDEHGFTDVGRQSIGMDGGPAAGGNLSGIHWCGRRT